MLSNLIVGDYMVKIAIIDNNEQFLKETKKLLENLNMSYDIYLFNSGYKFLKKAYLFNYVCLDIEIHDIDGILLSKKLRALPIKIIFITNHIEKMIDSFGVNVDKFILKNDYERILKSYFISENNNQNILTFNVSNKTIFIHIENIVLIEYILKDLQIILNNGHIINIKERSLKSIENDLNSSFYKINRSTLINTNYVNKLNGDIVQLLNYKKKVSRRKIAGLKIKILETDISNKNIR